MRIDKQLEVNQIRRDMEKRFRLLFWSFNSEDYKNPITKQSIYDSMKNIKLELDKTYAN